MLGHSPTYSFGIDVTIVYQTGVFFARKGLTTGQILRQVIAPATASSGRAFVDAFVTACEHNRNASSGHSPATGAVCGSPTHFVVHSHRLRLWDMILSLAAHQLGGGAAALAARRRSMKELRDMLRRHFLGGGTRYFYWIDTFCSSQKDPALSTTMPVRRSTSAAVTLDGSSTQQPLLNPTSLLMQKIGQCVLATDAPGTAGWACCRRWCLTELLLAKSLGCTIEVALTFGAAGALADGPAGVRGEARADGR